jgi:MYXO-CTERM domain-containing protein
MRSIRWMGALAGLGLCTMSAPASADGPAANAPAQPVTASAAVVTVGDGMVVQTDGSPNLGRPPIWDAPDPNTNRRFGPGYEQAVVNYLVDGGNPYVNILAMRSVDQPNIGPYQLLCTSYQLHADGPPTKEYQEFLTQNTNTKPANHPTGAVVTGPDGTPYIAYAYGSNWEGNRTATYVGVTNAKCQKLSVGGDQRVSPDADLNTEDDGAPKVVANGAGKVFLSYLSTGGNNDATYFLPLQFAVNGAPSLTPLAMSPIMVIFPSNIGRPTMVTEGDNREILCASFDGMGSRRPPGGGVQCAILDDNGTILWKNTIAASNMGTTPYNRSYMAQPTITRLGENQYALQVNESNGAAKNGNTQDAKGSNTPHLYLLSRDVGSETISSTGMITGAAAYGTHARICSGAFGTTSERVVNVISASPIGIGRGTSLIIHVDPTQAQPFTWDPNNDWWPLTWAGDSGKVSNLLGENPGRQGRDFVDCMGDVPNPGHGVDGGFMPQVKSFFVTALAGREVGWDKNGLYLSLLPAEADVKFVPSNPVAAGDVPITPSTTTTDTSGGTKAATGCGCTTPGGNSNGPWGALALGGLALVGLGARRRRA